MIKGPWPLSPDRKTYVIPLERPYLTPIFMGETVALRVSEQDHAKFSPGLGSKGVITDLDTMKRYILVGRACGPPFGCVCSAEIIEVRTHTRSQR